MCSYIHLPHKWSWCFIGTFLLINANLWVVLLYYRYYEWRVAVCWYLTPMLPELQRSTISTASIPSSAKITQHTVFSDVSLALRLVWVSVRVCVWVVFSHFLLSKTTKDSMFWKRLLSLCRAAAERSTTNLKVTCFLWVRQRHTPSEMRLKVIEEIVWWPQVLVHTDVMQLF